MADYDNLTVGQLVETTAHINGWQQLRRLLAAGTRLADLSDGADLKTRWMATGTYTGDGAATKAVTGVGFTPRRVEVYRVSASNEGVYAIRSDQDTSTNSLLVNARSGGSIITNSSLITTDAIRSLDSNGFTVGDGSDVGTNLVNVNSASYIWIAWG